MMGASQGLKSFWYTCWPYAVTDSEAVTFCTLLLVPDTSKLTVPEDRSNVTFALLTLMVASASQFVKPDEVKTSLAKTVEGARHKIAAVISRSSGLRMLELVSPSAADVTPPRRKRDGVEFETISRIDLSAKAFAKLKEQWKRIAEGGLGTELKRAKELVMG